MEPGGRRRGRALFKPDVGGGSSLFSCPGNDYNSSGRSRTMAGHPLLLTFGRSFLFEGKVFAVFQTGKTTKSGFKRVDTMVGERKPENKLIRFRFKIRAFSFRLPSSFSTEGREGEVPQALKSPPRQGRESLHCSPSSFSHFDLGEASQPPQPPQPPRPAKRL